MFECIQIIADYIEIVAVFVFFFIIVISIRGDTCPIIRISLL